MRGVTIKFFIIGLAVIVWISILFLIITYRDTSWEGSSDYDAVYVNDAGTGAGSNLAVTSSHNISSKSIPSGAMTYEDKDLHFWHPASVKPSSFPRKMRSRAGHNGTGLNFTAQQVRKMSNYDDYGFNVVASDMIPLDRVIPDQRDIRCRDIAYSTLLPDASVIITFYNEAASVLFRTITSVITHSPVDLLKEIILVDDASDHAGLTEQVDNFLKRITPKMETNIKLIRLHNRTGLIQARLVGVDEAEGDVLIFLDSHCECMTGWLEPLLHQISLDRRTIVAPSIDSISWFDFSYHVTHSRKVGAFNWFLDFRWIIPPDKTSSFEPNATPVIAGGLFAMDKQFFNQIGRYDTGMIVWGSENLEILVRVWTCGGSMLIHPCSHVGHVFREKNPYLDPSIADPIVLRNKYRFAKVWMDQYYDYYLMFRNSKPSKSEMSDIRERKELRQQLNCKSFEWYLKNVFPYSHYPKRGQVVRIAVIRTTDRQYCLTTNKYMIKLIKCPKVVSFKNKFSLQENQLRSNLLCLRHQAVRRKITLETCGEDKSFDWKVRKDGTITETHGVMCLSASIVNGTVSSDVRLSSCNMTKVNLIFDTINLYVP